MGVVNESDLIFEELRKRIQAEEFLEFQADPERMSMFELSYNVLRSIAKSGKISYSIDQGFKGVSDVSIIGKEITFDDPNALAMVSKLASNVNVYSRLDGKVRMDFTFYGTSRPVRR